jgi:hypothetical protein
LVIERFDTFDGATATSNLARGKDLSLFDGFRFDLDTGQVVPDGHGADLQFFANNGSEPYLVPLDGTKLYTLVESPLPKNVDLRQPSVGRTVVPADFQGRFRLYANGRTSGWLELSVDDSNQVKGHFESDQSGSFFRVTGHFSPEDMQKVLFAIEFPRVRQEFEGRLFTEGKGAIAGTTTFLDRSFGFFAVREKGKLFLAGGLDVELVSTPEIDLPPRLRIGTNDSLKFNGQDIADLTTLQGVLKSQKVSELALNVADDVPYKRLKVVLEALRLLGLKSVRFEKGTDPLGNEPEAP